MADDAPAPPGLDEATLEKLRRGFPLVLDRMGRFIFEGDEITHPGVRRLFLRSLDLSDDGEPILKVGAQWTYVRVRDTPLRVLRVRAGDDGAPAVELDDGRTMSLDPSTLWEEPGAGLRCAVPSVERGRPLAARFTNTAQLDLQPWLVADDDLPALSIGGERHPISETPPAGSH